MTLGELPRAARCDRCRERVAVVLGHLRQQGLSDHRAAGVRVRPHPVQRRTQPLRLCRDRHEVGERADQHGEIRVAAAQHPQPDGDAHGAGILPERHHDDGEDQNDGERRRGHGRVVHAKRGGQRRLAERLQLGDAPARDPALAQQGEQDGRGGVVLLAQRPAEHDDEVVLLGADLAEDVGFEGVRNT